ncbi:hypothetical protein COHA_002759 [Chlorella ohadii]|uniref:F-box domain-containing protein n=1 Tax=Chlorella ohadii TaxID=2649997 RepID=A0AAD5H8E6_9CHLO|nr:hypothetical protein COHA_002759 [Chlorella ohadii]
MATRQRQSAAGTLPAPPQGPAIQRLPDELLECILGKLDTEDRHRAALVSRRWHTCARAPELCRRVEAHMPAWWLEYRMPLACQAGLASFAAWLLRHKQHVRSMRLHVDSLFENEAQEDQAQLACCLMACLGSQLRALHVHSVPLVVAAWAPAAFAGLRQLHLDSGCGELLVSSSLHGLTQLTRLVLRGSPTHFWEGTRLPASIEQLHYSDVMTQDLPEQLKGNAFVPACLGQLTGLQALVFGHGYEEDAQDEGQAAAELNAALATLTQLTSLLIGSAVPPNGWTALAELPSLQRLCLFGCDSLPAGAWCGSLQELGVHGECLQRSCGVLERAKQLRHAMRLRQERPGLQVSRGGWSMRSAFTDSFRQNIEVEI